MEHVRFTRQKQSKAYKREKKETVPHLAGLIFSLRGKSVRQLLTHKLLHALPSDDIAALYSLEKLGGDRGGVHGRPILADFKSSTLWIRLAAITSGTITKLLCTANLLDSIVHHLDVVAILASVYWIVEIDVFLQHYKGISLDQGHTWQASGG
jgi:hypothetical protein